MSTGHQPLQFMDISTGLLKVRPFWSALRQRAVTSPLLSLQIEEFRRLRSHVKGAELPEGNDGMLGDNFRPTQPLSDRTVRAAFQWLSVTISNLQTMAPTDTSIKGNSACFNVQYISWGS